MDHLPIFLDIRGKACAVIGKGEVADRKAEGLRRAGANVEIAASLDAVDLSAQRLVIAATGDTRETEAILAACRTAGVLVNAVDFHDPGDFIAPALVDRAPVIVAISTGGASPVLARLVRAAIEAALPSSLGALAIAARAWRARVARALPDLARRRKFWEIALSDWSRPTADGWDDLLRQTAFARVDEAGAAVHEIVIDHDDPDRMTLIDARALLQADSIEIAHGVPHHISEAFVRRARRDATILHPDGAPSPTCGMLVRLVRKSASKRSAVV
jgi:uroporphyrin-III C-methyltransferase/precorrin-2 dehydrogenase/sirohydrochlorin ferrochelatase